MSNLLLIILRVLTCASADARFHRLAPCTRFCTARPTAIFAEHNLPFLFPFSRVPFRLRAPQHGAWLHLRSVFAAHPEPAVAALFSSHGQSAAAAGAGEGSVSGPAPVELKDAAKWLYGHALTRDLAVPFSPNVSARFYLLEHR